MAWKPKEKELSKEEALALARSELAPFWHNSGPLLAGVRGADGTTLLPLDETFAQKSWLVYFLDISDFAGKDTLQYAFEFQKRYLSLSLQPVIVLHARYAALADTKVIDSFLRGHSVTQPVVLDADRMLAEAFGVKAWPAAALISKNRRLIEKSGPEWMAGFEQAIQAHLRAGDPGLAMPSPLGDSKARLHDRFRLEFGRTQGANIPKPGFPAPGPQGFSTADFIPGNAGAGETRLALSGRWIQDGDRIATQDPEAEIRVASPAKAFGLVAQSLAKTREDAIIEVEVNDKPAFDIFGGEDLSFDDEGRAIVRVDSARLYTALRDLPADHRSITLRFPQANRVAIALYGLRFAE